MYRHVRCYNGSFWIPTHASIIRSVRFWSRNALLLDYGSLQLFLARANALVPRVTKVCVLDVSAISKPRTTTAATANFPRFLDDAARRAYWIDSRCRVCWFWHAENDKHKQRGNTTKASIQCGYICKYNC